MHYLLSTLYCFSTLYLDGNHGLAGLCICLLIHHKSNANRGSTVLKHTPKKAVLILCFDVCHLAYARWWSCITSVTCTLKATKVFLVSRWSLNNSSAYNLIVGKTHLHSEVPHGFPCWLLAHTGLGTCVDWGPSLFLVIAPSVSTLLVFSQETARARHNLAVWACTAWASKRWQQMCFPICRL